MSLEPLKMNSKAESKFIIDRGTVMSTVNLYKIDNNKVQEFFKKLSDKMDNLMTKEIDKSSGEETNIFSFTLYVSVSNEEKIVSWNWLLKEFDQKTIFTQVSPKAILIIEKNYETVYAVTFGNAFFMVDKYSDRDFGFTYGRKLKYEQIKTTTLTAPGLQRNKVVNTYIDYNELEFDSGESFAKLKAREILPDDFDLYKPSIEIGTSIRFIIENDSLDSIADLIIHVEKTMVKPDNYKIPVFSKVRDLDLIERYEELLRDEIKQGQATINISELDIIGVTEIFNNNDSLFVLKHGRCKKEVTVLNEYTIREFCEENNIDFDNEVLNIKVVSCYNGETVATSTVHDIVDYTIDSEKCLLSKGVWYKYNDDYLEYLKYSLADIEVVYNPKYDFSNVIHDLYIDDMFLKEKDNPDYQGLGCDKIKEKLKRKYYAERVFNELRTRDDGFTNYDRDIKAIDKEKIEVMDLYKDECMYAVKIGNTSAKLCYVVDQSLTALKTYKSGLVSGIPRIKKVAIWLVLENKKHIEDNNGKPVLDKLNLLMLKNRIDQWKKAVRIQGLDPVIAINYKN